MQHRSGISHDTTTFPTQSSVKVSFTSDKVRLNKVHVATYQLPVGLGDCSVHLLVGKEGEVLSGFIMDGGKDASGISAAKVIQDGLNVLKKTYGNKWKPLNAWVVTHWDLDHYGGMVKFVQQCTEQTLAEFFVNPPRLYSGSPYDAAPQAVKNAVQKLHIQIVSSSRFYSYFPFSPSAVTLNPLNLDSL
jgi:glyoxylase-like metal-dependent hydrolase (beta-lactamase superfamily II)